MFRKQGKQTMNANSTNKNNVNENNEKDNRLISYLTVLNEALFLLFTASIWGFCVFKICRRVFD